jgi:hypothetical protein
MAGCPRCARDLVAVNAHKLAVVHPNGFRSFKDLRVGERLNLPDRWFDGSMDHLPPSYFAALPHHDGMTPSVAHGVFGLSDPASDAVTALAQLDDRAFSYGVLPAALIIDQSVSAADSSDNLGIAAYAQATHIGTNAARQRNQDLIKAIGASNQAAASQARLDIQNDLLTAVSSAQLALQAVGGAQTDPGSVLVDIGQATIDPSAVTAAAKAAAAAIGSDPNFCASVTQPGSLANIAIHAFKIAWNAANPGNPVPINTGAYEQATADVLARVLGTSPPACGARAPTPTPPPSSLPLPGVTLPQAQAQTKSGLSTGAVVSIGLLGAGAVGGAIYFATRHSIPRVRRVRRVRPGEFS